MRWNNEKENLTKYILEDKLSYEQIGRIYNCTGAGVKKAAIRLGIPIVSRRIINPNENFNRGTANKAICVYCGREFVCAPSRPHDYCSIECASRHKYESNIMKWKNGEISGTSGYTYSSFIRRYMMEKYNNKCQVCGWSEINPHTGLIPLQIHHIDGDSTNNKEDNLQLLCPDCHSLTDNFGSRNKNAPQGKSEYFGRLKAQ